MFPYSADWVSYIYQAIPSGRPSINNFKLWLFGKNVSKSQLELQFLMASDNVQTVIKNKTSVDL